MIVEPLTDQLQFPEGPVALQNGNVLVVEILAGFLTQVSLEGEVQRIAHLGGGPNGAAIGPDGRCYVCNNGGITPGEIALLRSDTPDEALSAGEPLGRIEVIDIGSGAHEVLYQHCEGKRLVAPNDLVFDTSGGFYFTDFGSLKVRKPQPSNLYYAKADGTGLSCAAEGLQRANGVGLSPDGKYVYVSETSTGAVWEFPVIGPGKLSTDQATRCGGRLVFQSDALEFDSLAIDAEGNICVATLEHGSVARICPRSGDIEHFSVNGSGITNICFSVTEEKAVYITDSPSGTLIKSEWPCAGSPLAYSY